MARKKTSPILVNAKASLGRRFLEIRRDFFGEHGGAEMARFLGLPQRTWYNYETGITIPAEVLLGFIEKTGVNPAWLFRGEGPKYNHGRDERALSNLSAIALIRHGLEKLEQPPVKFVVAAPANLPGKVLSDFIAVPMLSLERPPGMSIDPAAGDYIIVYRHWLPNPSLTVGVRLADDAMYPILPAGSVLAVDRSVTRPHLLHGRIVAASVGGLAVIRWLDISGRHMILRPNRPSREHPLIPIEIDGDQAHSLIIGRGILALSRFGEP